MAGVYNIPVASQRPNPAEAGPTQRPNPAEKAPTQPPNPAEAGPAKPPNPAEAAPTQRPNPAEAAPTQPPTPAETAERPPLVLGQGEQRLLRIPGLVRYSLGGDSARISPLPRDFGAGETRKETLLVKGIHPGPGDLWVWKQDGNAEYRSIRVEAWLAERPNPPLERALAGLNEVEVLRSGAGAILRGEVRTLGESARVSAVARGFPQEVHNETELAPALLQLGQERLEAWLKTSRNSDRLRVERQNEALWVRGALTGAADRAAVERRLRAIFPDVELELEALPDNAPTVHFRVYLLELKKSRFGAFGLSWPASQAAAFQVSSWGIHEALQLDVALQALEGEGSAKILSRPELVVRAPGEAELFAGGELPIRTQSHYFSSVSWKNYGLTLHLKVTNVAGALVRLDILTEVSHLDEKIGADSIPGIQTNRMKTQIDARFGTPLLLSGLLQEGMREQAKGLPLLRQLPILGALFGSEDYLKEQSELVAILLPSAAPPPAPMDRVERTTPRGPVPPPRAWLAPEKERALRASSGYPWNALE